MLRRKKAEENNEKFLLSAMAVGMCCQTFFFRPLFAFWWKEIFPLRFFRSSTAKVCGRNDVVRECWFRKLLFAREYRRQWKSWSNDVASPPPPLPPWLFVDADDDQNDKWERRMKGRNGERSRKNTENDRAWAALNETRFRAIETDADVAT